MNFNGRNKFYLMHATNAMNLVVRITEGSDNRGSTVQYMGEYSETTKHGQLYLKILCTADLSTSRVSL